MNSSKIILSVLLSVFPVSYAAAGLFTRATDVQKIFNIKATYQEATSKLEEEKKQFDEQTPSFEDTIKNDLDKINLEIGSIKSLLDKDAANEFLKRQQTILSDEHTTITNIQRSHEQIGLLIDQRIETIKKFLVALEAEQKVEGKLYYTFEDLQASREEILSTQNRLDYLKIQEQHAKTELENREKSVAALEKSYTEMKEKFAAPVTEKGAESTFGFTMQQRDELFKLEDSLYRSKKRLYELRLNEINHKLELINLQMRMAKSELEMLNEQARTIRVRVTTEDVAAAKAAVDEKRQKVDAENRKRTQDINLIGQEVERIQRGIIELSKRANITVDEDIKEWTREPKVNPDAYVALYQIGVLSGRMTLLERQRELLEAQTALANGRINEERVLANIKETYYRMTTEQLRTDKEITQEVKKYDVASAEVKANLSRFQDKRNTARNFLNIQKKIQGTIEKRIEELPELRTTVFKGSSAHYTQAAMLLNEALQSGKQLMDAVVNLADVYADTITALEGTKRHVDLIVKELTSIGMWRPTEYALRWEEGIRNIVPDIRNFMKDVRGIMRSYVMQTNLAALTRRIADVARRPLAVVFYLVSLLLLFAVFWVLRRALPYFARGLLPTQELRGAQRIRFLLSTLFSFLARYCVGFFIWFTLLLVMQFGVFEDPSLRVLFYLGSIPYLLYFSNRLIRYFSDINKENKHVLLGQTFEARFFMVLSTLVYASIFILFFRQAFMLATYHKTQLPQILLALNFIILQISLISLITREWLLGLIPERPGMWEWLRGQVDTYYYLILMAVVALIVFSNPYVGYGKLVLYLLIGALQTALLVWVLFLLHGMVKKVSLRIFFYSDEGIVRERFPYSKTWYGVSVIGVYFVLLLTGFVIGSYIWGRPIGFADLLGIFNRELINISGRSVTAKSLSNLFVALGIGFAVSFAVNRFVLRRVFDLLLVDAGIQNTISSLTRYLIFVVAIFFGFQRAGLQDLGTLFYASILGIAWIIREPLADFVSYFIILVQRPIKVGDLIKMDDDTIGVVRKITARSVVLRRKNSVTLVVPNSHIISKSVTNWNYSRNFIAFNDILLTIPFNEDPQQVKDILLHVLDEHPNVLKTPKPIIRLDNFADYGFVFMIRGFVSSSYTLEIWDIASDIRFAAVSELRKNNVKIASPTRIVRFVPGHGSQDALPVSEGKPDSD